MYVHEKKFKHWELFKFYMWRLYRWNQILLHQENERESELLGEFYLNKNLISGHGLLCYIRLHQITNIPTQWQRRDIDASGPEIQVVL